MKSIKSFFSLKNKIFFGSTKYIKLLKHEGSRPQLNDRHSWAALRWAESSVRYEDSRDDLPAMCSWPESSNQS